MSLRVGSVSFLNARPLIYGLERRAGVAVTLDVPANLLEGLREGHFDVALLPVIDYQRMPGLRLIPDAGCIGSDGETLTVRVFSRVPPAEIQTLACDPDSHTSVALARVVLARRYGARPELLRWNSGVRTEPQALLLIGDKVVCDAPVGYAHQLDLGAEWKAMTGLPFVFAAWFAAPEADVDLASSVLSAALAEGQRQIDAIVAAHGIPRGWPAELARRYLTEHIRYDFGEPQRLAIERFFAEAATEALIPTPLQPLCCATPIT